MKQKEIYYSVNEFKFCQQLYSNKKFNIQMYNAQIDDIVCY